MAEKEKSLEKLKKSYEIIKKKYSLPSFEFLNENFEIEGIDSENTELLIKQIRKHIVDKISTNLRVLELFINPSAAPVFIMNIIKLFSQKENDLINELYLKLASYEIEILNLEAEYNEKNEVEFIIKITKDWKELSTSFKILFSFLKENHKKDSKKQEKSYFG